MWCCACHGHCWGGEDENASAHLGLLAHLPWPPFCSKMEQLRTQRVWQGGAGGVAEARGGAVTVTL